MFIPLSNGMAVQQIITETVSMCFCVAFCRLFICGFNQIDGAKAIRFISYFECHSGHRRRLNRLLSPFFTFYFPLIFDGEVSAFKVHFTEVLGSELVVIKVTMSARPCTVPYSE